MGVCLSAVYVSFFSFKEVVLTSFCFSVVSYLALIGVKLSQVHVVPSSSVLGNIKKGITYIYQKSYIRQLIPIALIMNVSFWRIFLLLPKLTIDSFPFFKTSYSFLELSFSLGGILGGYVFAKYLVAVSNKFRLFVVTLLLQSILLIGVGFGLLWLDSFVSYLLMLLLWGGYAFVNTMMGILYFGSVQSKVPHEIMGSVIGAILTIFSLANPFAAIISGYLVSYVSIPVLILFFATVMFLTALLVINMRDVSLVFTEEG